MTTGMSEEEIYEQEKQREEAKRGFYWHLTVYVIVNIILVLIWTFASGRGYPWFLWPLGGWGVFVLLNFLQVFVLPGKGDKAAIEKEVDKIRRQQ